MMLRLEPQWSDWRRETLRIFVFCSLFLHRFGLRTVMIIRYVCSTYQILAFQIKCMLPVIPIN